MKWIIIFLLYIWLLVQQFTSLEYIDQKKFSSMRFNWTVEFRYIHRIPYNQISFFTFNKKSFRNRTQGTVVSLKTINLLWKCNNMGSRRIHSQITFRRSTDWFIKTHLFDQKKNYVIVKNKRKYDILTTFSDHTVNQGTLPS